MAIALREQLIDWVMPIGRLGFGPFTVDPETGQLLRGSRALAVTQRDLAVLHHLLLRSGQVVSTDEILETVWADTFVVRGVVKTSIHRLRSVLEDAPANPTFIETVGRRGYRFLAAVRRESASSVPGTDAGPALGRSPRIHRESPAARVEKTPFVGRDVELARLAEKLDATLVGRGGLAFLVGEPGIGKTRLLEEFAARARPSGVRVLWGRCYEGELARPFGAFAEAIAGHASECDSAALSEDLGGLGGVIARIAPELRAKLPQLADPVALSPEEERPRLLDAVAQLFWAIARRAPLVLVLDDLHWADGATLAMLRHVARFLPRHPVLVLGAYRDVELDPRHPLAEALAELRRSFSLDRVALSGLGQGAVAELLETVGRRPFPRSVVAQLTTDTAGNPLFLRELVLHLLEEGALDLGWRASLDHSGVPEGIRDVIFRRLSRLSDDANRLLATASGHGGPFRFEVAAAASGLDQERALDALDEALQAQILRSIDDSGLHAFSHALIRYALYADMSAARRVRLHRRLAEELERFAVGAESLAIEVAHHYQCSASLPGSERGADYALLAAGSAEKAGALEEAADALRIALELLPSGDSRRARATARLVFDLAWGTRSSEALELAPKAAELLAASEGDAAAAEFIALLAQLGRFERHVSFALAREGLRWTGDRRDGSWAVLRSLELDEQDTLDPSFPGMILDSPERREAWQSLARSRYRYKGSEWSLFTSAAEALASSEPPGWWHVSNVGGDLRRGLGLLRDYVNEELQAGRVYTGAGESVHVPRLLAALGELDHAEAELARFSERAERAALPPTPFPFIAELEILYVRGADLGGYVRVVESIPPSSLRFFTANIHALMAILLASAGRSEDALREIAGLMPAVERCSGGADGYTGMICWAVEALWAIRRADFADSLKHNLFAKTIEPGFKFPQVDARRAMAKLCALTGGFDEARDWFERARLTLEEQGARPLRALIDFDEAEMELRRGRSGDAKRALARLEAARRSFASIGMTGWLQRADELHSSLVALLD